MKKVWIKAHIITWLFFIFGYIATRLMFKELTSYQCFVMNGVIIIVFYSGSMYWKYILDDEDSDNKEVKL